MDLHRLGQIDDAVIRIEQHQARVWLGALFAVHFPVIDQTRIDAELAQSSLQDDRLNRGSDVGGQAVQLWPWLSIVVRPGTLENVIGRLIGAEAQPCGQHAAAQVIVR